MLGRTSIATESRQWGVVIMQWLQARPVERIVRLMGKKKRAGKAHVSALRSIAETRLSCGEASVAQGARIGRRNSEISQLARAPLGLW